MTANTESRIAESPEADPNQSATTTCGINRCSIRYCRLQWISLLILSILGHLLVIATAVRAEEITAVATEVAAATTAQLADYEATAAGGTQPVYQLYQYEEPARNATNSSAACHQERGCRLCGPDGLCAKCVHYITADDRRCVLECPRGYVEQWSNSAELLGIVCHPNGYSDPMLATIVSLTVGACACLLLVIGGVIALRRKQRQRQCTRSVLIDETVERDDFLKQLDELRPNAEYFLALLNDTRRQIRKLFLAGDQPGANAYRTIVRDLAKVLILLNRPVELISRPPHDWPRVYAWARRILDRCKPQLAQLIQFLQPDHHQRQQQQLQQAGQSQSLLPGGAGGSDAMMLVGSSQYSTFKSTHTASTLAPTTGAAHSSAMADGSPDTKRLHAMHLFGSLISLHDLHDEATGSGDSSELHPTNPFRAASSGTLRRTAGGGSQHPPTGDVHGSSLWLEDEFFKLGFRPQDEITTEL